MNDPRKTAVGRAVVNEVQDGMLLGLGTGSTATEFLVALGARLRDGRLRDVRGVATSNATERVARELNIPLAELPASGVHLAVDGMDEVDPSFDAIKGLGGALLREKVVAESARRFVLIGGRDKQVPRLGTNSPLPVEVLSFGRTRTETLVRDLGLEPSLRAGENGPFLSDNGHPVLDCRLPPGADPAALAASLDSIPGVVGHGFFLGMAHAVYLADDAGVHRSERPS